MSEPTIQPRSRARRVMLPDTARVTREAADTEDARKIRFGVSPSYFINLGDLVGNQYTGYGAIYPRKLYRFDKVHPTGINEDPDRIDEDEPEQSALQTITRSPRTCAEDVRSIADDRVFVILSSLTDRDDIALDVWDLILPVQVEAEIFAMTDRNPRGNFRGPTPEYLIDVYKAAGLDFPYVKDGHPLDAFVKHLEASEARLQELPYLQKRPDLYEIVEATRAQLLQAAMDAFQHRAARLSTAFGLIESRKNSGVGMKQLDRHALQCIAETGIEKPEDRPVLASQKMGAEIGHAITAKAAETENSLASAVDRLAAGQEQTNRILQLLLEERAEQNRAKAPRPPKATQQTQEATSPCRKTDSMGPSPLALE